MMNSTSNMAETLLANVKERYNILQTEILDANQVTIDVELITVHSLLTYLRGEGWDQLSILTCVDWIEEGKYQLVYILFNWETPVRIQVRAKVERPSPKVETIMNIYPGAKYYERDVHEFFGVVFEGNPDSNKQLFLENWDDIPPLRKDFNSKEYSDKKYKTRTYEKNYNTKEVE